MRRLVEQDTLPPQLTLRQLVVVLLILHHLLQKKEHHLIISFINTMIGANLSKPHLATTSLLSVYIENYIIIYVLLPPKRANTSGVG